LQEVLKRKADADELSARRRKDARKRMFERKGKQDKKNEGGGHKRAKTSHSDD
jgi:hypothetical protein